MDGHVAVIDMRLEALERAIRSRDWGQVEWEYDRVRRAVAKLARERAEPRPHEEVLAEERARGEAIMRNPRPPEDHSVALRRATDAGLH